MVSSRDAISGMEAGDGLTGELAIDLANTLWRW
jgi:hypothetical protein